MSISTAATFFLPCSCHCSVVGSLLSHQALTGFAVAVDVFAFVFWLH